MPIYEYECRKCKRAFEYMQKMSEGPRVKCEACGGRLERQISAAGFILKGGGWYKDLYASQRPGGGDKAEASGGSKPTDVKVKADAGGKSEKVAEKSKKDKA